MSELWYQQIIFFRMLFLFLARSSDYCHFFLFMQKIKQCNKKQTAKYTVQPTPHIVRKQTKILPRSLCHIQQSLIEAVRIRAARQSPECIGLQGVSPALKRSCIHTVVQIRVPQRTALESFLKKYDTCTMLLMLTSNNNGIRIYRTFF